MIVITTVLIFFFFNSFNFICYYFSFFFQDAFIVLEEKFGQKLDRGDQFTDMYRVVPK